MPDASTFNPDDLRAVAQRMRDLDICMLSTRDGDRISTRPMSNNGQVEFDGASWFFAPRDSAMVRQITTEPSVGISYSATESGTWIALEAEAEIIDDEQTKRDRWFEELGRWFENGPEDPEVVLVRATATRVRAWGGEHDLDIRRG